MDYINCIYALIICSSANEIAKVVLPFLNNHPASKEGFKYSIHDDGDNLFIDFTNKWKTELYFMESDNKWYNMHLSNEVSDITNINCSNEFIRKIGFDLMKVFDKHNIIYRFEITKELEDGSIHDEEYFFHPDFPND